MSYTPMLDMLARVQRDPEWAAEELVRTARLEEEHAKCMPQVVKLVEDLKLERANVEILRVRVRRQEEEHGNLRRQIEVLERDVRRARGETDLARRQIGDANAVRERDAAQEHVRHLDVYIDKYSESIRKIQAQYYAELSAWRGQYKTRCLDLAKERK